MESDTIQLVGGGDSEKSEDLHLLKDNKSTTSKTCLGYPLSTYFIVFVEFCERFSYYGMKAVFILYLVNFLEMNSGSATALYHFFTVLCYFFPLLGGFISDVYLGKFKTILSLSILYLVGEIIMSTTAVPPPNLIGPVIAILLIGCGTGGIKPCVSAFGGDQIPKHDTTLLDSFFSIFYFAINVGSLLAMILTPLIRANVKCFNKDCYALSFGVSAIFMATAIIVFLAGRPLYIKNLPQGNVVSRMFQCVSHAIRRKRQLQNTGESQSRLLDYSTDKFEVSFIEDLRQVKELSLLILPFPVFWALFDQQGSRWTLQSAIMDGYIGNGIVVQPDQMQAINAILIVLFIPLFDRCIYPLLAKCRLPLSPFLRIGSGMLIAAVAFVMAGFLQMRLEADAVGPVAMGQVELRLVNLQTKCDLRLLDPTFVDKNLAVAPMSAGYSQVHTFYLNDSSEAPSQQRLPSRVVLQYGGTKHLYDRTTCQYDDEATSVFTSELFLSNISSSRALLLVGWWQNDRPAGALLSELRSREREARARIRVITALSYLKNATIFLSDHQTTGTLHLHSMRGSQSDLLDTGYVLFPRAKYNTIKLTLSNGTVLTLSGTLDVLGGSAKTLFIREDAVSGLPMLTFFDEVKGDRIHMLYQIPQYIAITVAEILISITGLAFFYSEAPDSMKSLISALWLLAVALGNVIVMIVAELQLLSKQSYEFFMFSGLMGFTVIVFSFLAARYKPYVRTTKIG